MTMQALLKIGMAPGIALLLTLVSPTTTQAKTIPINFVIDNPCQPGFNPIAMRGRINFFLKTTKGASFLHINLQGLGRDGAGVRYVFASNDQRLFVPKSGTVTGVRHVRVTSNGPSPNFRMSFLLQVDSNGNLRVLRISSSCK